MIHPENVQTVNYTARIALLGVGCAVGQDELQTEAVMSDLRKGKLCLSYSQRTFDIMYESINMRNHFDIAYRYKMESGEWSQPTALQYIRFVDVKPGELRLTLQCISRTSGTVLDTKTLTIFIDQPWWNTWWMWCVYVIFLLLAFSGAWRIYELHEKYMRLTIDYLQLSESHHQALELSSPAPSPSLPAPEISDAPNISDVPDVSEGSDAPESAGKEFVDKATKLIVQRLDDTDFNIDQLCREMAMSRTLFYVKLKSYTGKSPQDFIRIIRLERAAAMLRSGRSVTDVAALTGFDNPKYFSTVFKKYFGVSPSKYQ